MTPHPKLTGMQPGTQAPSRSWAGVLAMLAMVAWSGVLWNAGFAFDDREGVLANPQINGAASIWSAFLVDYWHHMGDAGHYRPMAVISLAFDHRILGASALAFHLSSILAHSAVVFFGALFVRRATSPKLARAWLFGLALFAVHPALADAVAWISGRSSPLSVLPGVFFAWLLVRKQEPSPAFACACIFAAALLGALAKEDGMLAASLPLWIAARQGTKPTLIIANCAAAAATYFALRFNALGVWLPAAPHAPLANTPLPERLAAAGAAMSAGAGAIVWPINIPPAWRAAPWPSSPLAAASLLGWSCWLTAAILAMTTIRRHFAIGASLALAAIAWIPVQQWIPAGEIFAPRFLYQPLFFASLPIGWALAKMPRRATACLFIISLPLAWQQAQTYTSLFAYESATLQRFPHDARAWNGLGLGREERGNPIQAIRAFETAIEIDPTFGRPHSNLARLDIQNNDLESAATHLAQAAQLGAGNPIAWNNLGAFNLRQGQFAPSQRAYERASQLAPGLVSAWRGLARSHFHQGHLNRAHAAIGKALELEPTNSLSQAVARQIKASGTPTPAPRPDADSP